MDRNDRQAIADLFERLREAERRSPPRDREAEAFIRERIAAQPSAPYYLAQTVIVQQQALEAAQDRIAALENGAGSFGSRGRQPQRPAPVRDNRPQPWGNPGGGFLAGAAQTALGVAGGVLLGNMIADTFFGGNDAYAADGQGDPGGNDANSGDFGGDSGGDSGGGDGGGGGD